MPEVNPSGTTTRGDTTRTAALLVLCLAILAIAIGYAAAFRQNGAPVWAPWLLALGIPISLGAIMTLGAARGRTGIGPRSSSDLWYWPPSHSSAAGCLCTDLRDADTECRRRRARARNGPREQRASVAREQCFGSRVVRVIQLSK